VGERFSDVNIGCGEVVVWADIRNRQRIQLYFIYGNLNAQRYCDKILRPIVVPLIRCHHLMFQHNNAQPHVARICTQFLEAQNVPEHPWPACPDQWLSVPFKMREDDFLIF
jgi:hypothetical protein